MTKNTLADHAIVVFVQALAVTIWNFFDESKPEERNRDNFIRVFDGYLGEIVRMAEEKDSLEVRKNVKFLRAGLKQALDQVKLAKAPTGKPI